MELKGIGIFIQELKTRQVGACLSPDTLVLTAKLEWKRIDDLIVGEEIIAADEGSIGKVAGRKLRTATVLAKFDVTEPTYKITMENGATLIATADHRFLCKMRTKGNRIAPGTEWRKVNNFQLGDAIRHVSDPWEESTFEDGWMSGILDGEGSYRWSTSNGEYRKGVEVTVTQTPGLVLDRIIKYFADRNYNYRVTIDNREAGVNSKLGSKPVAKVHLQRINELFRLMGQTRPSRFIDARWWEGKGLPGKGHGAKDAWTKIINIEKLEVHQRMVDLQTTTGTYIANGFVSHNSTDDQVCMSHRALFYEGTRGMTVSSKEDKTRELASKMGTVIDNLPWYLLPTIQKHNDKGQLLEEKAYKIYDSGEVYYEAPLMNSRVRLQFGTQTGGIGRGETPDTFHGTEIPDWTDPKEDIQNSLMKSIHNDPRLFFVLESTGKYVDDYWHQLWQDSIQYYFRGESRFYPIFLAWYAASDIYPTRADVRAYMPSDFKPSEETEKVAIKCQNDVKYHNDLLRKYLGADWKMSLEQKWFYEWDKNQARREKRLATWLCEMPSSSVEAFAIRGSGMFDAEFIEQLRERSSIPDYIFGVADAKSLIPFRNQFLTSEVDSSLSTIPLTFKWSNNNLYHNQYTLYPLKLRDYSPMSLAGRLLVWELPDENEEYEIGEDCGDGVQQDFTCIYVMRKGDYMAGTLDKIVAAFYSNEISAAESLPFLQAISQLYVTVRNNQYQQPKLVIERPKGGAALIQEMIKAGWKNFFTNRNLAIRQYKDPSEQLGWEPNQQQRDALLSEWLRAIRDFEVEIPCQFVINQLATFGYNITRRKIEALAGHHDDAIFAPGMAWFSINSFNLKGKGDSAERRREQKRLAAITQQQQYIYTAGDRARPVAASKSYSYWNTKE
jgi:hypothetical protein